MAYVIAAHPLLSPEAGRLDTGPGEALAAQQQVAELVLGLRDTDYTGAAETDAENALALQVSLQVAADPETYLASDVTRGSRSITYRDGVPLHPLALEIVAALAADAVTDETVVLPRQSATVPLIFSF